MPRLTATRTIRRSPRAALTGVAGALAVAAGAACLLSSPPVAGAFGTIVTGSAASPTLARPCAARQIRVWLGDGPGGGTAGAVYYPLEFSNVGHSRCTLYGYPGVSAYGSAGRRIGAPAARIRAKHRTVTLVSGATAHALLGIRDWGAVCSKRVSARGLRVYAPGARTSTPIAFPFGACARARVLVVGPVRSGVGIPGDFSASPSRTRSSCRRDDRGELLRGPHAGRCVKPLMASARGARTVRA